MRANSIRFKTSILYSIILFFILDIFGGIIFLSIRHILYADFDEKLRIKVSEITSLLNASEELSPARAGSFVISRKNGIFIEAVGLEGKSRKIIDNLWRAEVEALSLKEDYINVFDVGRRSFLFSSNYPQEIGNFLRKMFISANNKKNYKTIKIKKNYFRFIESPFLYKNSLRCIILIGSPAGHIEHILNRLFLFILAGIVCIVVVTSFLGKFLAYSILKPVAEVARIANNISHHELGVRIPAGQIDTEMKYLVDSFNSMISRLQKAFGHINEFSSHVAHELKTPLAIVKGEIELALERDRLPDEYKRVLRESLDELNKIIRTTQDLFLLAQLDYRTDIFKFEQFDFIVFLAEICEHARVLSSTKEINFSCGLPAGHFIVNGDKVHLRRLFFNILDNAVKFTPPFGDIDVLAAVNGSKIHINISDNGEGIPEQYLTKIFDKFFRVPGKKQNDSHGIGLGLSIARSIALAHDGDITANNKPEKGCIFTIVLPLC
jgi:signal transduction histidine kinase